MGHDKAEWPADMRGVLQEDLPLLQAFAHQADIAACQITQAAMCQLGAGRGGGLRQIALFYKANT
jgi:hypothetical protein